MLADILRLSDRELDQLRDALSQGTIGVGAGISRIRSAGLLDHSEIVQSWLSEAAERLGSIDVLTDVIGLIRAERGRSRQVDSRTELILSGPNTGSSPTRDTRVVVREIFESVKKSVLIVGYAFYGSDSIFEPLARRMGMDSAISARFIVNIHPDRSLSSEHNIRNYAVDFLRSSWPFHPRPLIYYLPGSLEVQADRRSSVHAKMIVADREDVYLGSANFTTAAFHRNIEAGLRLRSATLGRQLVNHFDQMIQNGLVATLPID